MSIYSRVFYSTKYFTDIQVLVWSWFDDSKSFKGTAVGLLKDNFL
jgi:hypothetical protein